MRKIRFAAVVIALLATVSVAMGAMIVLWTRHPTFLVTNMNYLAKLVDPVDGTLGLPNAPEVLTYTRIDQHTYRIAVQVLATYQITNGSISVNMTDIPAFLNVTIASIELWTVYPTGSSPPFTHSSVTLATAPAFGAIVILGNPSTFVWDSGIQHGQTGLTDKYVIVVNISEYQIGGSAETDETLTTTITLGVPT